MWRRVRFSLLTAVWALVGLSGCGDDRPDSEVPPISPSASNTAPPASPSAPVIAPAAGSTTEVSVPRTEALTHLKGVGAEVAGGGDRVTFEFDGPAPPGYSIGYTAQPLSTGEGNQTLVLSGGATLRLLFDRASGVDLSRGFRQTYNGPPRLSPSDAQSVVELARVSDNEGQLIWAIGTRDRRNFLVTALASPTRIVIDFPN